MATEFVHIGFGNILAINKVVAIVTPSSAPAKRMIKEAKQKGILIDMTSGRKTKSLLVIDGGQVALAAIAPETIASRLSASREGIESSGQIDR